MPLPTDSQKTTWRALFRVQAHARRHADAALKQAGLPPLEVYDVLLELDRNDAGEGLTAKQLEQRLLLPQYGVSRLLTRLERQALVARRPNPADHRSSLVSITGSGRALRAEIWQVYGRAIAEFFASRMRPGRSTGWANCWPPWKKGATAPRQTGDCRRARALTGPRRGARLHALRRFRAGFRGGPGGAETPFTPPGRASSS